MRFEGVGLSVFGATAVVVVVLAIATVWLFLTNPIVVATAVSDGEITPFIRNLASLLVEALAGLLKYL